MSLMSQYFPVQVLMGVVHKVYTINHLVDQFFLNFNKHYDDAMSTNFNKLSLQEQADYLKLLFKVRHSEPMCFDLFQVCYSL